jgi:hypothetical protein
METTLMVNIRLNPIQILYNYKQNSTQVNRDHDISVRLYEAFSVMENWGLNCRKELLLRGPFCSECNKISLF